jgi:type IV pilus assembly protein PilM
MLRAQAAHNNLFFRLFPPPKYLAMPAAGLDITDNSVRFAELKTCRCGLELGNFGSQSIPEGAIEEGFIKSKTEAVRALAALRRKFGLGYVNVSLPEEKSYLFNTELPPISPKDIRGALKFKIEENVPVKLPDAVFDFFYLTPPIAGQPLKLGVAVAHTKVVESYMEILTEAGLTPLSLQIESQAVARVAVPVRRKSAEPLAHIVIAVKDSKTIFSIVSGGLIRFSSTVAVGGKDIAKSIEKSFSVSSGEAVDIRQGRESRERDELLFSLVNAGSAIRDEVGRLLAYWESHGDSSNRSIGGIYLVGSDVLLGLNDYLSRSFEVPVRVANVWQNICSLDNEIPTMTYRESLDYATALGLAVSY